jgi:hypothetical protein
LYKISFVICCFIFCTNICNAQREFAEETKTANTKQDTAKLNRKHEHIDTHVDIYYKDLTTNKQYQVDTTIYNFHRDRYLNTWQHNLGNSGSIVNNLQASIDDNPTKQLGYTSVVQPYLLSSRHAPMYNTSKAYTEFWYKVGTLGEQSGELMHTQNFSPTNNFSIRYNKFGSPGFFKFQETNHDHLLVTLQANFSKRISTKMAFAVNQIKQEENGGIVIDTVLQYANYALRTTVPVLFAQGKSITTSAVNNYFRTNEFTMQNNVILGYKKSIDSSAKKVEGFQLVHTLHISGQKQVYKDVLPDSIKYTALLQDTLRGTDSLYARHRLQTLQNEFGGQLPNIAKGKITLNANFGIEVQQFSNNNTTTNYVNNYLKGNVQSTQPNLKWQYAANIQLYILGNSAGNYVLNGFASRKISNYVIELNAVQSLQSPSFVQSDYYTNKYNFNTNFNKIVNTSIGGTVSNTKHQFTIKAKNNTIINYIYWDSTRQAKQTSSVISILSITATKNFTWRKWSWLQELLVNQTTPNTPINLPQAATRMQVAYTNQIFKNTMLASIGVDAFYNLPYATPTYHPIIAQFGYNTAYQQPNNAPRVGVFFNSKIKRFRVFVSADELLQIVNSKNRILVNGYPATDYIFRAGFCWAMIN